MPEIAPGVEGTVEVVTPSVEADDVPQLLIATTLTFPELALVVVVMLFVVEVPLHPEGKVQV